MPPVPGSVEKKLKIKNRLSFFSGQQSLIDLAFLYVSKSGSVVVGLFILPLFNRQLGPDLFGMVALVFTIQAISMVLDLGMSTVISRDLSFADVKASERYATWRAAERLISLIYLALLCPVLIATWAWDGYVSLLDVFGCLVLFWALTLQNISQNALLARQKYVQAALLQITGLLARHGITAIVLAIATPTIFLFIAVQATVSIVQMLTTRWCCTLVLRENSGELIKGILRDRTYKLFRASGSLMLVGLSGTAVMQLDKVIISGFLSARELTPYFLAFTLCMVPISVLAAPVAQFFQPRLVLAISSTEKNKIENVLVQFNNCIAIFVLLPASVIWQAREPLISIWLNQATTLPEVVRYCAFLLPGTALGGALGFVPSIILIAYKDYQFMAKYSLVMTIFTLGFVLFAASQESILAVCAIYSIYHITSAFGLWCRCIWLDKGERSFFIVGARHTMALTILVVLSNFSVGYIFNFKVI